MPEHKLIIAEVDALNRCQARGDAGEGQCKFIAVEGFKYCPKHAGPGPMLAEKRKVHQYMLELWQTRVDEFAEGEDVKTLRGEIGIMRMMVESIISRCTNAADLHLYSGKIAQLVGQIQTLVVSTDKLETRLGMILDKAGALALGAQIVEIIVSEISDPSIQDRVSNRIIDVVARIGKETQA